MSRIPPYLKKILDNVEMLPAEVIASYLEEYRQTNSEEKQRVIKNIVVTSNLKLVVGCILKNFFASSESVFEDFFQAGTEGLTKAVEYYKPDKGAKFSTYSVWWIKQGIYDEINKSKHSSMELEYREEDVQAYSEPSRVKNPLLDTSIKRNGRNINLNPELIKDKWIDVEEWRDYNNLMNTLDPLEFVILKARAKGIPLKILGKKFNYSTEGIRNLEIRATIKVKEKIK